MASGSLNKFTKARVSKLGHLGNLIFLGALQKLFSKMKRSDYKSIKSVYRV